MIHNVRIVLVNPSHPGNIGATARAMKTMGLSDLCLVNPKQFPDSEATARASGADDLLDQARVVNTLQQGLQGCQVILGTSARQRSLSKPLLTARQSADTISQTPNTQFAILFGCERTGLSNEELSLCHQHVMIPSQPDFSSLNLAAAVQIMAYELYSAKQSNSDEKLSAKRDLAPADQLLGFYQHLEETLTAIHFLDPKQPKLLMQRLQRLFNRAMLDSKEINILRGILSNILTRVKK